MYLPALLGAHEPRLEVVLLHPRFIGIMEKNMKTSIVYRGYIGIMEKLNYYNILALYNYLNPRSM